MIKIIKKLGKILFQNLGHQLFFFLYGRINGISETNKEKKLSVRTSYLDNHNYKVYQVECGRLYTDTINDTAVIIDNKIVEGPSFQFRPVKNADVKDNIVFKKGTPRIKKNVNGTVLSLLTGGAGNSNYWHWMFDVLPRIEIANKILTYQKIDNFLVPSVKKKFQFESLDLLDIDRKKILPSNIFRHIEATFLLLVDHPYVLNNDPSTEIQQIPKWIIQWLRLKFLVKNNILKSSTHKKIYIERNNLDNNRSIRRKIINEDEVKSVLLKNGFHPIKPEILSFNEQVNIFSNADFIIGLHGAAFANMVFSKKNTKILEIQSTGTANVIRNLAISSDLLYDCITIKPDSEDSNNQDGYMAVSIDILKKKITKLEQLK